MMETITNHVDSPISPDSVQLSPANLRRLHRLHNRAEMAQEMFQAANQALQETLAALFEDAGIQAGPQDGFSVDWRSGTLSLRRQGEA